MQDNILDGCVDEAAQNASSDVAANAAAVTAASHQEAAVRAQDTRAVELEELRKRNVAKTMQEQLDGKGQQPITKEIFYQKQKHQLELIKQQKLDAEANLHNFRNKIVAVSDSTKEELKKKEMEAAALLHSYRGKPEAILSHQVKKYSNVGGGSSSRENLQQYVEVVSPSSRPDGFVVNYSEARSIFDESPHVDVGLKGVSNAKTSHKKEEESADDADVDDFLASLDKEFVSTSIEDSVHVSNENEHDTAASDVNVFDEIIPKQDHDATIIHQKNSESSNENSTESTGWVVLDEKQENQGMDLNSYKNQVPSEEIEEKNGEINAQSQNMGEWNTRYVTVSFDLLTDAQNAPPVQDRHGCGLLSNLMNDMQVIVEESLQKCSMNGEVTCPDLGYKVDVVRDGKILFRFLNYTLQSLHLSHVSHMHHES
jgi:hypothetical protein